MGRELGIVGVYLLCKLIAYLFWVGWGLKLHGHPAPSFGRSLLFAVVRLIIGAVFGTGAILWLIEAVQRHVTKDEWQIYLLVYVPIRWLEWSLMVPMIDKAGPSLKGLVVGRTPASAYWRLGGILISCLSDIPILLAVGRLPIGRFLC